MRREDVHHVRSKWFGSFDGHKVYGKALACVLRLPSIPLSNDRGVPTVLETTYLRHDNVYPFLTHRADPLVGIHWCCCSRGW